MPKRTTTWMVPGIGLFVLALLVVACGGGEETDAFGGESAMTVDVSLTEFAIDTDTTAYPVGVPVTFNITNDGVLEHNFIIEPLGTEDEPLNEGAKLESIQPGETATITFTFDENGDFQLGCHIPGHYEAGMVTEISVGS